MKGASLAIITIFAFAMGTGTSGISTTAPHVFAMGLPAVVGPCPQAHECVCTAHDGVLHDLTSKVDISIRCDGTEGANEGQ